MREVLHADGLAVGPVEVIAESGSNVNIRNVFNIYLVGDGFSKDALEFVASESDEEGGQSVRVKRGPLIIEHLPRIHRRHEQSSSSTSRSALESSTAVTGAMAAEAGEAKEEEEKEKEELKPTALLQETSSIAAPTSKHSTRASTTAAVHVSSSKSSSAPTSTSRTSTRAAAGGRIDPLVNRRQTRDQRIPAGRSTATPARRSPTSASRLLLDDSIEAVDLSPEAVAVEQPRGRRSTVSTPTLRRGMRSAPAETATGFSRDASVEAVDRSPEALPEQPPQSRLARHSRGQQRDADSEAFVPEHVALSNEDW